MCFCFLIIHKWADCIFVSGYTRQALGSQLTLVGGGQLRGMFDAFLGVDRGLLASGSLQAPGYMALFTSGSLFPSCKKSSENFLKSAPAQDHQEREKKGRRTGSKVGSRWALGRGGHRRGPGPHSVPVAKGSSPGQVPP